MVSSHVDCPFCYENIKASVIKEYQTVVAVKDRFPVCDGHLLIIPKRHCRDFFEMTVQEQKDANHLLMVLKNQILEENTSVTGFNVGTNAGIAAGQTVFHCHIHLIPRTDGDTPDPTGGVRGVIPEKMNYKK